VPKKKEQTVSDEKSKIYVDDDWKKQAQAEKQRLKEQEKKTDQTKSGPHPTGPLPRPDLGMMISSFLSQALLSMGVIEHPDAKSQINLDLAKFNIGMLEVLEQKTQGNLTDQEQKLLNQALQQGRMAFIEIASKQGPIG